MGLAEGFRLFWGLLAIGLGHSTSIVPSKNEINLSNVDPRVYKIFLSRVFLTSCLRVPQKWSPGVSKKFAQGVFWDFGFWVLWFRGFWGFVCFVGFVKGFWG